MPNLKTGKQKSVGAILVFFLYHILEQLNWDYVLSLLAPLLFKLGVRDQGIIDGMSKFQ